MARQVMATAVKTVLVADDCADFAYAIGKLISHALTVKTITVMDGLQALEETIALKPAVVVLDIEMPIMSGIEAAIAIRGLPGPAPVLIAVSGVEPSALDGYGYVFDFVFGKPPPFDALMAAVSSGLANRDSGR